MTVGIQDDSVFWSFVDEGKQIHELKILQKIKKRYNKHYYKNNQTKKPTFLWGNIPKHYQLSQTGIQINFERKALLLNEK